MCPAFSCCLHINYGSVIYPSVILLRAKKLLLNTLLSRNKFFTNSVVKTMIVFPYTTKIYHFLFVSFCKFCCKHTSSHRLYLTSACLHFDLFFFYSFPYDWEQKKYRLLEHTNILSAFYTLVKHTRNKREKQEQKYPPRGAPVCMVYILPFVMGAHGEIAWVLFCFTFTSSLHFCASLCSAIHLQSKIEFLCYSLTSCEGVFHQSLISY